MPEIVAVLAIISVDVSFSDVRSRVETVVAVNSSILAFGEIKFWATKFLVIILVAERRPVLILALAISPN